MSLDSLSWPWTCPVNVEANIQEESARMEYYTLGKRNVHWANSVWHVAAGAHCITSPPPPCTLPSLVETFCKHPAASFDRSECSPEYGHLFIPTSEWSLDIEFSAEMKMGNSKVNSPTTRYEWNSDIFKSVSRRKPVDRMDNILSSLKYQFPETGWLADSSALRIQQNSFYRRLQQCVVALLNSLPQLAERQSHSVWTSFGGTMKAGDLEIIKTRRGQSSHPVQTSWAWIAAYLKREKSPVAPRKYSFSVRRWPPREFSRPRPCGSWGQAAHAVRTECRLPRPQRSSAVASRRRPDRVHRKRTSSPPPSPASPAPPGECFSPGHWDKNDFLSAWSLTVKGKQLRQILASPRCTQGAVFQTSLVLYEDI